MNDELIFFLISLRERRIFSKIVCFLLVCHTELFIRWYRVSPKYCLPTKHICPCPDCWGQSHSESPPKSGNLPFFRYSFTFFFLVFFYTVHLNSHNAVDLYLHLILRDVALNLAVLFWFRENILFFGGCCAAWLIGSYFPGQGSNPDPLQWKWGVLTTGPTKEYATENTFKILITPLRV